MVDTSLRPWLIEINSSPAMDYSTVLFIQNVTEELVKEVSEDLVKVIVDFGMKGLQDTGNFEILQYSKTENNIRNG